MEMGSLHGQMGANMKVSTLTTKSTASASSSGLTVASTKESGHTESSTEWVATQMLAAALEKVSGPMAAAFAGTKMFSATEV